MEKIEEVERSGNLQGKAVFLCMDDMVWESTPATGYSELEVLFDLVVQLHYMIIHFELNVRSIHMAGNLMIIKGMEGLSRGNMHKGIMMGETMLSFCQLKN